jgi:hypothetical protein
VDATQSAEASCHHQSRSAATGRTHRGTQMTASPRGWPPAPQEAGSTAARPPGLTGGRNHRPQRIPRLLSQQKRITITTTQTRCARAGPQPRPAGPSAQAHPPFCSLANLLTGEQEARPVKENNALILQHLAYTAARKCGTTGVYLSKISQRHQHTQESRKATPIGPAHPTLTHECRKYRIGISTSPQGMHHRQEPRPCLSKLAICTQ